MGITPLCLTVLLLLTNGSAATENSIRLRFEAYRNGTLIANPEVSVSPGSAGRVELPEIGAIAFTPTCRTSDAIAIDFDIQLDDRHVQPRLVIGRRAPGSMSWPSVPRKDALRFTVAWVP